MEAKDRIIYIDETAFRVDLQKESLIHMNQPAFEISGEDLKDEDTFYTTLLDKESKQVFKGWIQFGEDNDRVLRVVVPKMLFEEGFWDKPSRISEVNKMSAARQWNILVTDEKLRERLSGKLPLIDIGGTDFIIDWRLKELREKDNPHNRIELKHLEMDDAGENYLCLYDWGAKQVYAFDRNIKVLPENVTALQIPYELRLDPVAVAREYGLKDVAMLSQYPIQEQLTAKVIPLSETALPKLVLANQKKATGNTSTKKQDHKSKKGRSL